MPSWISGNWGFLVISLALHGLMGMLLPHALLSKPSPIPPVIAVRIIEEKRIPEEKKVPPTVRRVRQEIPPLPKIEERKDVLSRESLPPRESSSADIIRKESNRLEVQNSKETFKEQENAEKREDLPTPEKPSEEEVLPVDIPGEEPEWLEAPPRKEVFEGQEKADRLDLNEKKGKGDQALGEQGESNVSGMGMENASLLAGKSIGSEKLATSAGSFWIEPSEGSGRIGSSGIKGKGGEREKRGTDFLKTGKAGSVGSSAMKGQGDSAYLMSARMRIEQAKRYPREAIRKKWEGKVVLSFQIDQRGEVGEIKIVQSSGHRLLDEEGKATIRRASPFPAPPSLEKEKLQLQIPILFRLDREN